MSHTGPAETPQTKHLLEILSVPAAFPLLAARQASLTSSKLTLKQS